MSKLKYIIFFLTLLFSWEEVFSQEKDLGFILDSLELNSKADVYHAPFYDIDKKETVSTISTITGDELSNSSFLNLSDALQGKLSGLQLMSTTGEPGTNASYLSIRGKSSTTDYAPLVLVDGIARDWVDLNPEEIESITVLKDMTAKAIYGLNAANGVVLITTKRGISNKLKITVGYEQGIKTPTTKPEFLAADEYASLYNTARSNDGLAPHYTDDEIKAYRNGTDPILYPNNDYYGYAMKNDVTYRKGYLNFIGGSKKSNYFVHLGYVGQDGLENVGTTSSYDRINIRTNLGMKLTDVITGVVDVSGRVELYNTPNLSSGDYFNLLSTTRPNEYPIFIHKGGSRETDILGGSLHQPKNIYGELNYTGYDKNVDRSIQTRFGFDLDFNEHIMGLSADVYVAVDGSNTFEYGKDEGYNSYMPLAKTDDGYDLFQVKQGAKTDDQVRKTNSDYFSNTFYGNINYDRTFREKHKLSVNALGYRQTVSTSTQFYFIKTLHAGLNANYTFKNKYVLEGSSVWVGTNKLAKDKRVANSSAVGAGWIISNEGFLEENKILTHLKIKGSAGLMAYDPTIWTYMHLQRYGDGGVLVLGENNSVSRNTLIAHREENMELSYEQALELNLGIEVELFDALALEVNYFDNARKDMITNYAAVYPDYYGNDGAYFNNNSTLSEGIEGAISYNKTFGDIRLNIGANLMYQQTKWEDVLQMENLPEGMNQENRPIDGMYGYRNQGLFQSDNLARFSPSQTFGTVGAGDIRYQDINGDGVINNDDQEYIGNTSPTLSYGIQFGISYKNVNLFVAGAGFAGHYRYNDSKYYQMSGLDNYSEVARNSWTPELGADATYPALTTTKGENNYVTSDFWLEKADFFRIKNVEVGYTLPRKESRKFESKFFIRANNLFEVSAAENKNVDPERPNSGITEFPIMRSYTMGINLNI
ncbi:SusC/RagA family TonB-linked outer membrane protein [Flammeovirga agarivorans]|uniref:SusC/RagA family TonB-linked outer membrane protein n=1 Tax=Flammeovirga agarivorans TaxID=2726742 RepID=A0A7X8SNH5_9BACT|nr:SusC/RagA family TonB-linked outer membrane protein [Flammeovirga agarivorans]NLR93465.1 SusC/RagA family TonB-linked outer membrane protein [Flammeovirga agarivorans]